MFLWMLLHLVTIFSLLDVSKAAPNTASSSVNGGPTSIPAPLVVSPSQEWEGNDGPWSSFFLRVGTPPQTMTVLISTAGNQPIVVLPQGCSSTDPSDCASTRGGIFSTNTSSTWVQNNVTAQGIFAISIEQNLNISVNALYGSDTVSLGLPGSGLPSLQQQVVGGIAAKGFYMGMFGLNPAASNFSTFNDPVESYMATLKSQNDIPSLSFGYTAGAPYRFNKVLGSLTLGGYDTSLFEPNELTIAFDPVSSYELTINVNSINLSSRNGSKTLSSESFPAIVDSSVPYLYLPLDVCEKFEEAFGITYDASTDLYLVNDTLHTQLLSQAANVTFTVTNVTSEVSVDIVLPYQAFDLIADYPLVQNAARYFPLKRAQDNSETTLGRAFLQEAYIIADYERSNFSLYQRKWDADAKENIQTILPLGTEETITGGVNSNSPVVKSANSKTRLSIAAIVAIVVGSLVLLSVVTGCIIIIRQRSQKLKMLNNQPPPQIPKSPARSRPEITLPTSVFKHELDSATTLKASHEMSAGTPLPKFASLGTEVPLNAEIHELPANLEGPSELLGSPVVQAYSSAWRERQLQEVRRKIWEEQNVRRIRLMRNSP